MDLEKRKGRLKMLLEMEHDKEMLKALVAWTSRADELSKITEEEKIEEFKKVFSFLLNDESRKSRLFFCNDLLKTFMESVYLFDGLSAKDTAKTTREVLNSLNI